MPHTGYVVTEPCFQDRCPFHFAAKCGRIHYTPVRLQMCGKMSTMAKWSRSGFCGHQRATLSESEKWVAPGLLSVLTNRLRSTQRLCKEVITWKWLRHPNILPLLGVVTVNRFRMVSEWMPNGNINEFVKDRPNANLQQLVCFSFCPRQFLDFSTQMITVACRCQQGVDLHA